MNQNDKLIVETAQAAVGAAELHACGQLARVVHAADGLDIGSKNGTQTMAMAALAARLFARAVYSCRGNEPAMLRAGQVFESNYWQLFNALAEGWE